MHKGIWRFTLCLRLAILLSAFHSLLLSAPPTAADDPVCRRDPLDDVNGVLAHASTEVNLSGLLPQSMRSIRLTGISSVANPKNRKKASAMAYLEISAKGEGDGVPHEATTLVNLRLGESYYGFLFEKVGANGSAYFRSADGKLIELHPGYSGDAKLFDSLRPLATEYVNAISAGDEAFVMKDLESYRNGGGSKFQFEESWNFEALRDSLQIIASSQKNDFLHFFTLSEMIEEDDWQSQEFGRGSSEVPTNVRQAILSQAGYAYLEPLSQRLYISKDYVKSCADPIQRNVAPWLKGVIDFIPAENLEKEGDEGFHLFRRCITPTKKEGVCCSKFANDSGVEATAAEVFECVERKDFVAPEVLDSCHTSEIEDECGRFNENQGAAQVEGKACRQGDALGRCRGAICISEDHYQDQFPCRVAHSKDYAKYRKGLVEKRDEDRQSLNQQIENLREQARRVVEEENIRDPEGQLLEEPDITMHFASTTNHPRILEIRTQIEALVAKREAPSSEADEFGPSAPNKEPIASSDELSPERFAKKVDGSPCGVNQVCRDGECIPYRAADWKDYFERWKQKASEVKIELIQQLAEKMAGQSILLYPTCIVTEGDGPSRALPNGNSCFLEEPTWKKTPKMGNCWEGQCLPCDRQSDTKLLGIPACPEIPGYPGKKGKRRDCSHPEYCVYDL